jgi:hypothetical protein
MSSAAAELAMVNQEGRGQAQQRLRRQEGALPADSHGTPRQQLPELLPSLASRQLQVIRKGGHALRLLPGRFPQQARPMSSKTDLDSHSRPAISFSWSRAADR